MQRFASLKDCVGEPSGPYFALKGTEKFTRANPNPDIARVVDDGTLFAHRQHAGQGSAVDQLVAISPVGNGKDREDKP